MATIALFKMPPYSREKSSSWAAREVTKRGGIVKALLILTVIGLLSGLALAQTPTAAAAAIKLQVIGPTKPVVAGDDITLEVILSTDGIRASHSGWGHSPRRLESTCSARGV